MQSHLPKNETDQAQVSRVKRNPTSDSKYDKDQIKYKRRKEFQLFGQDKTFKKQLTKHITNKVDS